MSRRWVLLVAALAIALVGYTLVLHQVYTWRANTHPDFYIEWIGSRVALQGGNPYSDETTQAIQLGSKGQQVAAGEDQLAFVYPFYRVFINAPVAFLPYDWAAAIWQTVMQASLFAGVLLLVRSLQWRIQAGELVLVLLVTTLAYPTFGAIVLGQMAVGVLALLLIAFWATRAEHYWLAGTCLAVATVKPQLVILAIPALLIWTLVHRQWRVAVAFVVTLLILVLASWAVFPSWIQEFAAALTRYPLYKNVQTGPGFLFSGSSPVWPWLLEAAATAWLLAAWWLAWQRQRDWLAGAFVLTLAMSGFLLPQTSIANQLMLLPAVVLLIRDAPGGAAQLSIAIVAIAGSWVVYATLYRSHYELAMALPPLISLLALAAWYIHKEWKHGSRTRTASSPA